MEKPIIIVIGTRAEAIKLIPLYLALQQNNLPALLCATDQHLDMLKQACKLFEVTPDFNLNIMKKNQDLFYITNEVLTQMKEIYLATSPSLVIVQGDTTTTMAAALAAFYLHIPIGHVEAGLRTGNMQSPFPEEMNRKVVGQVADYHFAPTAFSTANLLAEGIDRKKIFCTGNTIVDALLIIQEKIKEHDVIVDPHLVKLVRQCKQKKQKIVLLTAHRRESFHGGLTRVFCTMKLFAQSHPDVAIIFPVHPNPNVRHAIDEAKLEDVKNILFFPPIPHTDLVYLLSQVDWVASDSGGIQEEAVSLGKKILVLRDITERWEGVWEGAEVLVGTDENLILKEMERCYNTSDDHKPSSVYGDGHACKRIVTIIKEKMTTLKKKEFYEDNFDSRLGLHRPSNGTRRSTT